MFISVDIKKGMISDWKKITRMHTVFLIDKTAVGEDHKYAKYRRKIKSFIIEIK